MLSSRNKYILLYYIIIIISDLDKSHMKRGGLHNKHICEKNKISPMRQQKLSVSTFPIISLWEL